jgi:hypothetical protein
VAQHRVIADVATLRPGTKSESKNNTNNRFFILSQEQVKPINLAAVGSIHHVMGIAALHLSYSGLWRVKVPTSS